MKTQRAFSLRARLTLLLALAVLVVFGAAARIVDWRADSEMQQRFDASLLARAQSLASLVQVNGGRISVDADDVAAAVFPGAAEMNWYDIRCGGRVVARTAVIPPETPSGSEPVFADALVAGNLLREVTLRFHPELGEGPHAQPASTVCVLHYALDRGPLDDILQMLDFVLLGSLLGACVLVILATPWLVRRGLRPLVALDQAMAGIGPDQPGGRLPTTRTTELKPLVARFNEVLARMDAGLARERQFASGLAHEFRTRLAELRTLVDVERRYPSGRDTHSLLDEVGHIGAELEATVTALLQLTRIQSGIEQSGPESVSVTGLVTRVRARHRDAAVARRLRIEFDTGGDPAFSIETDPVLLEIALDNLLGNAVAYAPEGSAVTLQVGPDGVEVSNAAPALHPDDLVNFGQRFWRKGAQGEGHAGLGLALAGAAARALGMALSFELDDGVLRATLRWSVMHDSR